MPTFAEVVTMQGGDRATTVEVVASADSGPFAGRPIIVAVEREQLLEVINKISKMPKRRWRKFYLSVRHTVRTALQKQGNPTENNELMDDLVLMFALYVNLSHTISVLEHTGLMDISLLIDDDESLPWHLRGMLPPDLVVKFNLNSAPAIIS